MIVRSIFDRDYPVIQGVTLAIGIIVLLVNLLTDLCYAMLDPRVSLRMSAGSSAASALPTLASAADAVPQRVGRLRRRWMNSSLMTGLVLLGIIALFAIGYPFLVDWSPTDPDFAQPTFAGPSWDHPLGTDNFGRDTLTRLAYGGRVDLVLAFVATAVTVIAGGLLGLVGGYVGGWFDTLVMRLVDFAVTIPYLVLVIAIVAILGTGTNNLVYAIWLVGWITYARIVRAETMVAKRLEYVEAARVIGMGNLRIMLRHILPNVVAVAIIFSMADFVLNILDRRIPLLPRSRRPTPEPGMGIDGRRVTRLLPPRLATDDLSRSGGGDHRGGVRVDRGRVGAGAAAEGVTKKPPSVTRRDVERLPSQTMLFWLEGTAS